MSPIFDFLCPCGHKENDRWAKIEERTMPCPKCNVAMKRLVGNPRINMGPVPTGGYYDDTLGCHIETKRQWEAECKKQNVTPKGDTPKVEK